MSFFISNALADTATTTTTTAASGAGFGGMILPLIALFVFMYFFILRPQNKRAKEHRDLLSNLAKGDEVVTNGGLLGKISQLNEDFISLIISNNVEVKIQKNAITAVLPKGTIK